MAKVNYTILDAKGANGVGKNIFAADFRNAILSFDTDGGGDAALTVKFQGSIQETTPDFSAAQSATNQWEYIEVVDLQDGTPVDGITGIAVATADDHRMVEANINALTWLNAEVSSRTAGEVTVKVTLFSND